jgi:uncharacterized protein
MKSLLPFALALLLSGCVSAGDPGHHPDPGTGPNEMRVAFDVTDGNPKALLVKLSTIDLTRKQWIEHGVTPRIVLAFRGDASYFTQSDMSLIKEADREDAAKIQAKIRELSAASGVAAVEQCNIPLASRKIKPANLMGEVKLVPNAWISLVEYQQKGYSYIVP